MWVLISDFRQKAGVSRNQRFFEHQCILKPSAHITGHYFSIIFQGSFYEKNIQYSCCQQLHFKEGMFFISQKKNTFNFSKLLSFAQLQTGGQMVIARNKLNLISATSVLERDVISTNMYILYYNSVITVSFGFVSPPFTASNPGEVLHRILRPWIIYMLKIMPKTTQREQTHAIKYQELIFGLSRLTNQCHFPQQVSSCIYHCDKNVLDFRTNFHFWLFECVLL